MFMKQYNYKPRSNSQSSQGSSGQGVAGSPPKEETKSATGGAGGASIAQQAGMGAGAQAGTAGRRRSSAGAEKFAGLQSHKRSSGDQAIQDRKASWADQKPGQTGILGGMWNSFTKGS